MAKEIEVGCARPTGGPVGEDAPEENKESATPRPGACPTPPIEQQRFRQLPKSIRNFRSWALKFYQ